MSVLTETARFNKIILFIWLAAVFTFPRRDNVFLRTPRLECPGILSSDAEQEDLSNIAEIEADAATIWAAIFADFVPNYVAFVFEAPMFHDFQPIGE